MLVIKKPVTIKQLICPEFSVMHNQNSYFKTQKPNWYFCRPGITVMLDKLEAIKGRFDQLGVALTNPDIVSNNRKFADTSKEYRSLEKIVFAYNEYKKILDDIEFYKEALNGVDEEMRELAKTEAPGLEEKKIFMESAIRQLLIPKDPQDEKNAILEIRAGTGGDEASLFAG